MTGSSCLDDIGNPLFIEDISDPYNPTRVNALPGYFGILEVSDDYLFLESRADLFVLNIGQRTSPKEIGFFKLPVNISHLKVSTGYIYVTGGTEGLFIFQLTRSITGQIIDANQTPYPGVIVESSEGISTTVGADGYYTFTNPLTGTYTVTPTCPGYVFEPASRSLVVPSYAALEADFTILPSLATITLTPGLTSTLTLTDTQGLTTILLFPAGAVTETLSLTLTPTLGTSNLSWLFAGHAFELGAYREGVLLPGFTFSLPVTVTIHYSDVDIRLVDESQLTLWAWVGGHWQDAAQGCEPPAGYYREEDGNVVSLAICGTGGFKLMGPTYPTFLPVVSTP